MKKPLLSSIHKIHTSKMSYIKCVKWFHAKRWNANAHFSYFAWVQNSTQFTFNIMHLLLRKGKGCSCLPFSPAIAIAMASLQNVMASNRCLATPFPPRSSHLHQNHPSYNADLLCVDCKPLSSSPQVPKHHAHSQLCYRPVPPLASSSHLNWGTLRGIWKMWWWTVLDYCEL